MFKRLITVFIAIVAMLPLAARAEPLVIRLDSPVIEPIPFALPAFDAENAAATQVAADISQLVAQDLTSTGLFRQIPSSAFISQHRFTQSPSFADWRAINAQAMITGAVAVQGDQVIVKFRLYDVFAGDEMGDGLQFVGTTGAWRRMAHKVADQVYSRITGENGYFDSRVIFVTEDGPKENRIKSISIMDQDGFPGSIKQLTTGGSLVLAPRFSPTGDRVLYTSYETGTPRIFMLDVQSAAARPISTAPGDMAFTPRFSPDGTKVVYSLSNGGNTDIWMTDVNTGAHTRLTNAPSIETAPSLSPDGSQIVFESDRSGSQQLYIMSINGGEPRRISFGEGRYGTPVWSPRGDLVAFTKQSAGRFHIGVMRTDGSQERLLTSAGGGFQDEGPTWSPNGRVLMFFRETLGQNGGPSLYSVDILGRNLRQVSTGGFASDPSWGPLQR